MIPHYNPSDNVALTPLPPPDERIAATQVALMNMGISSASNAIDIPFTQIDKEALWKYKEHAENPLGHTIFSERELTTPDNPPDTRWKASLDDLFNRFPAIKERVLTELGKAEEDQNPALMTFISTLEGFAKVLSFLEMAAVPVVPDTPTAQRQIDNTVLPFVAMTSLLRAESTLINNALALSSPNDLEHDELLALTNQIGGACTVIRGLLSNKEGAP